MDTEQIAIKLQETTDRSIRNEGRIKKLEDKQEAVEKLATSVAVMAEQMKQMNTNVSTLNHKVDEIESRPAKRWEAIVGAALAAIVAAVMGYALGHLGL